MTTFTNQINQADFEALVMSELEDMELTPEQLAFITGGGFWAWVKKTAKKAADWAESTFGDGDGEHEVSDYIDEVIAVVSWFKAKSKEQRYKNAFKQGHVFIYMSTANADCFKEIFITPPLSGVFYAVDMLE